MEERDFAKEQVMEMCGKMMEAMKEHLEACAQKGEITVFTCRSEECPLEWKIREYGLQVIPSREDPSKGTLIVYVGFPDSEYEMSTFWTTRTVDRLIRLLGTSIGRIDFYRNIRVLQRSVSERDPDDY